MTCLRLINVFGQGVLNILSRFGFAPQLWPGFSPYEMSKLLLDFLWLAPRFLVHPIRETALDIHM
jgi:hypothetical protein